MHRTSFRAAILLPLLLLAGATAVPAQESFTDSTSVVVVEVPVQVVRDGQPVAGLKPENFEVWEGRKRHAITGFESVDLRGLRLEQTPAQAAAPAAAPRVSVAARRHFLLLFDLSFSDTKSIIKAREAAAKLVSEGLHPTDLVAVGVYTASRGPALLLGFTSDRQQVELAIATLGVPNLVTPAADPLGIVFGNLEDNQRRRSLVGLGARDRYGAAILDHFQEIAAQAGRMEVAARANQVVSMSRSFADLAKMMAGVTGRKHVVYLSEGIDSSLLYGSTDPETMDRMNRAAQQGLYWRVDSDERFGSTRAQAVWSEMLEEFRRADCIVQAVDVGGVRVASDAEAGNMSAGQGASVGEDALHAMAEETGGELYRNFNDLSVAMEQMLDRTSVTYVLSFQPDDLEHDGRYRQLRVELKGVPGARAVHRPGYYAPKPAGEQAGLERRLAAAERILGAEAGGDLGVSVLAAPFRGAVSSGGAGGAEATGSTVLSAYVPVVVEIDGASLLEGTAGDELTAEIYAYAFDAAGEVRGHFSQSLGIDLAKARPALAGKGLKFYGHLDLPPADYSLRVFVRNGQSGRSALAVVPLAVPDFATAGPVLLPAFFPDAVGGWVLARADGSGRASAYPFVMKEEPYYPAVRPEVKPDETARVALVGYNLGRGPLKVGARVLAKDGREVPGARFAAFERTDTGIAGLDRLRAALEPAGLPPGEYTLVVEVTDTATGVRESSTAPFVVVGS